MTISLMMQLVIKDRDWDKFYNKGAVHPKGVPEHIVNGITNALSFLESMDDFRDAFTYPGFDSKKKTGVRKDHYGIRINIQRRVLFKQDKSTDPITIIVDYIDNGHYK